MELTRREFIKSSIYFPSAVKAWMKEQIDGDEQVIYQAFLPFVGEGARELGMLKIEWFRGDIIVSADINVLHNTDSAPKMKRCDIRVVRIKGGGAPPIKPILQPKGAGQDGMTWSHDNLEPRDIELSIVLDGTYEELWEARRFLVQRFTPLNSLEFDGKLLFTVPGGSRREIFCRYRSGLDFDDLPEDATQMTFPLRVWAEYPLFQDNISDFEQELMTVPPWTETYTINNGGDWNVFPAIVVIATGGTLDNPLVENVTTGESMQLTRQITIGQEVVYTLDYGNKDITIVPVGSILNNLDTPNDLDTFHLQPGDNDIRITIDNTSTGVTTTRIGWNKLYLSL